MDYFVSDTDKWAGMTAREKFFSLLEGRLAGQLEQRSFIFGISGVDTAGKTEFASAFQAHLDRRGFETQIIHLDDFHNPSSIRRCDGDSIQGYLAHAFDLQRLVTELLEPARHGAVVDKELALLDLDADAFTNRKRYRIGRGTVVILEGVLLFRPPVEQYISCKVYLDISFDEVLRRAAQRDVPLYGQEFLERYKNKYIPLQQHFMEEFKPKERSDFVIDNTDFENPKVIRQS